MMILRCRFVVGPVRGETSLQRRRSVIDMIVSIFDMIISKASSGRNHPDRWQICRSLGGLAVILILMPGS